MTIHVLKNLFLFLILVGAGHASAQMQTRLVVAKEQKKKIQLAAYNIVLSPATVIQILEDAKNFDVKLISGQISFEERAPIGKGELLKKINIDTTYFKSEAQANIYLSKKNQQVEVFNFSNEAYRLLLRDGREHVVLGGFQNWVSGLGSDLVSTLGMPRKIDVRTGIEILAEMTFNADEFNQAVVNFKKVWKLALSNEVFIYRSVAAKMIEEEEFERLKKIENAKNKRAQALRLRQEFFTQTFSK